MKWSKPKWERITSGTHRMKVFGGWIVSDADSNSMCLIFVPDPNHEWQWKEEV